MGLRIRTNVVALRAQREMTDTTNRLNQNMERLASGFRINRSADDSAGIAISETMRARIRSYGQARRNAQDGVSMIQVAESGMNEISSILIRLRELSIQSASDTLSNLERTYTNREYGELVREVDRIANTVEFNGLKLFGGQENNNDQESLSIYVGIGDNSIANTDTIELSVDGMKLDAKGVLALNDQDEIGPLSVGDDFDRDTASQKISVIDRAIGLISSNRATLGSKQSRLNSAISNIDIQKENLEMAHSRIKDVDFASETASFTQNQILAQAGTSIMSHANALPQSALSLLS